MKRVRNLHIQHLLKFLTLLLSILIPLSSLAAELSEEDKKLLQMKPEELLNSELTAPSVSKYWEEQGTTSVSKKGEDPFNTPAAVYIISAEDIKRSGVTSVMEALRMAPGVQVARIDSNKWAISARGFNFIFSKRIRVLIDGQAVINPLISGIFWDEHMVPIEEIDRIEVIRGSGGVTWGTNAVNGVINIITKHSKDTEGKFISGLYGSEERGTVYARYGKKANDRTFYRSFIEHKSIESLDGAYTGRALKDDWSNSQAGFRIDGVTTGGERFLFNGTIYTDDTNSYLNTFPEPPIPDVFRPEEKKSFGGYLNGRISKSTDKLENTLQSYLQYSAFSAAKFQYNGLTYDLDFQQTRNQSARNEIIWGLGYRLYSDKAEPSFHLVYDPIHQLDNLFSAFLQDKYALIEDRLYLTLGSKFEYHDKVGFDPQPSARLSYNPTSNQTLWAAISRTARFPTRGERNISRQLFGVSPFSTDAFAIFIPNNGHMKSDKSTDYEVGYRVRPFDTLSLDFTAFYNDYTDLISYTPTRRGNDLAFVFLDTNKGTGRSYGAELSADWQARPDLKLEGTYSLIDVKIEVPPSNITLDDSAGSPRHQFSLRSQYNVTSNIFWDNSLYYVDELKIGKIPGYLRFDTRIAWKPIHGLELSIAGQNLLDDEHQEFSDSYLSEPSTIGRSVYVKAAWEF